MYRKTVTGQDIIESNFHEAIADACEELVEGCGGVGSAMVVAHYFVHTDAYDLEVVFDSSCWTGLRPPYIPNLVPLPARREWQGRF